MGRIAMFVACGVLASLSIVSCGASEPRSMTPASGVEPRFTAREASESIAQERCQSADRCGHIGKAPAEYRNFQECMSAFRADLAKSFSDDCSNGVADRALRECLAEIDNEDCSGLPGVVDRMDRYLACRASTLCLD